MNRWVTTVVPAVNWVGLVIHGSHWNRLEAVAMREVAIEERCWSLRNIPPTSLRSVSAVIFTACCTTSSGTFSHRLIGLLSFCSKVALLVFAPTSCTWRIMRSIDGTKIAFDLALSASFTSLIVATMRAFARFAGTLRLRRWRGSMRRERKAMRSLLEVLIVHRALACADSGRSLE